MQIRRVEVSNFRGIKELDWSPNSQFCCLIGAGDSAKSTILDAIEAALSTRWFSFLETDFHNCDLSKPISIEVTVGELSSKILSDEKFGLFIRGWSASGDINDEPEREDEPVLTIRLTVDDALDPEWRIYSERAPEARLLSIRDRKLFGVIRLSGYDSKHLTWGKGSKLLEFGNGGNVAESMRQAFLEVKRSAGSLTEDPEMMAVAQEAESSSREVGAYVKEQYRPGIDVAKLGITSGALSLFDGSVPVRLAGLGSMRLASLAIQKADADTGAIILVDEIEHGLEPHRIIGAICKLKNEQEGLRSSGNPIGQILITTHSDAVLGEVGPDYIRFVRRGDESKISIKSSSSSKLGYAFLRHLPNTLFAKRILIAEGRTEVGLILGMRQYWLSSRSGIPIEQFGSSVADGNGSEAVKLASELASLGYDIALYRDSDVTLTSPNLQKIKALGISVIEYGDGLDTESAIVEAASIDALDRLLALLRNEKSIKRINKPLRECFQLSGDSTILTNSVGCWPDLLGRPLGEVKSSIAETMAEEKWLKSEYVGKKVAPLVREISQSSPDSNLSRCLSDVESWLYADESEGSIG